MNLIAGVALGALVGTLVGLSSVPVVGAVVTALIALLVAFFGLQGSAGELSANADEGPLKANASAARVAGFGGGMLVFLLLAVLARAGGWLEPSIADRVKAYGVAGYPPELARELALYDHSNLLTGSLQGQTSGETPGKRAGLLFSDEDDANCAVLEESRFDTPALRLTAMQQSGGAWQSIGELGAQLTPEKGRALAQAAWQLACQPAK